jgi:hypothetical protein
VGPACPSEACESESMSLYFAVMRTYLERYGKPVSLHSDKAGIFWVNAKEPQGGTGVTQFGRAMSSLNIDILCANAHRPLQASDDLDRIFPLQLTRKVTKSLTVSHKRVLYVLDKTDAARAVREKRLEVEEREDGSLTFRRDAKLLKAGTPQRTGAEGSASHRRDDDDESSKADISTLEKGGHLYFGPTIRQAPGNSGRLLHILGTA